MMRRFVLAGALLLGACGGNEEVRRYAVVQRADIWQNIIVDPDRARLARLYDAWDRATRDVAASGETAALTALGAVAERDAAQPGGLPGAGTYRCRTIRLGHRQHQPTAGVPAVVVEPWQACRLAEAGTLLAFEDAPGRQQLVGTLYPDNDRQVFLGSVVLAGETGRLRYGADAARDQAGVLRRIGDRHWRIELPWPRWQSMLNLVEIRGENDQ